MAHLPKLIHDLALILITAGMVSLVFKRLRQPAVLGYIIAGFLVGPHFSSLPTVTDQANVSTWAEIGVVFLMFALGLEFSFRKLNRVGGAVTVIAIVEISAMITIGFFSGRFLGWTNTDSLFLGGMLAISSTTIILRVFEELRLKGRSFVQNVFGTLIIEDLVAVLLMVMLSTLAVSRTAAGPQLIGALAKLGFFLILWFVAGVFLLPTLLKRTKRFLSNETLIVFSVGLCFVMVVAAGLAGFSPALGAFIMGSILAETGERERIERMIHPFKDLFGAIFFVSVGMLINPQILSQHAWAIVFITLVFVCGKTLSAFVGSMLAGQGLRNSIQTGMSLAQIGEFSFIIASLGQTLGITSKSLYPVAVGVSVLTTFSTPYFIRSSDTVHNWIDRAMPQAWKETLARYADSTRSIRSTGDWGLILRALLVQSLTLGVLIIAVFLGVGKYLRPTLIEQFSSRAVGSAVGWLLALILSAPFLWALVHRTPAKAAFRRVFGQDRYRAPLFTLVVARWAIAIFVIGTLSTRFFNVWWSLLLAAALMLTVLVIFSRHLSGIYSWFAQQFSDNLSANGSAPAPVHAAPLAPWDAHLETLEVSPDSKLAGHTLMESRIRENFGVTIAMIERGSRRIAPPTQHDRLFPYDEISVIGTDDQIVKFRHAVESRRETELETTDSDYGLFPLRIGPASRFIGKSIRDSGIREEADALVVGVERGNERILNPDSSMSLLSGDLLWVVCDTKKARRL